jgi:hypothetical protein
MSIEFISDNYGFLKQKNPKRFFYGEQYKRNQATNIEMVELRLNWIRSHIQEELSTFSCVDVGSGNDCFVNNSKHVFKRIVPYDLSGKSISKKELQSTLWDMIFLTDVLEHFPNIDHLWKINFRYAYISYPEYHGTPLKKWRHYKPNEHVYCLNINGMKWFVKDKATIIASGCPEDAIRKKYDEDLNNITSIILKRIDNVY